MQNLPITDLVKEISSVLALVNGLGIFAAALWIAYRTKSGFLIRRRLWRWLFGESSEGLEPDIKKFSEEQDSLMRFIYDTGLSRVQTIPQARDIIKFMREKDVPPVFLCKVGHNFNVQTQTLRPMSDRSRRLGIVALLGFLLSLILALTFLLGLSIAPRALLSLKASGNYYMVDVKVAKSMAIRVIDERPILKVDMCNRPVNEVSSELKIPSGDVSVLCELMQHPEAPAYISESIESQRWTARIAAGLLMLLMWQGIIFLTELNYYKKLQDHLKARPALTLQA